MKKMKIKMDNKKITGYQMIGWSCNIKPEDRNNSNMSDGVIMASMDSVDNYSRHHNFLVSDVREKQNVDALTVQYYEDSLAYDMGYSVLNPFANFDAYFPKKKSHRPTLRIRIVPVHS